MLPCSPARTLAYPLVAFAIRPSPALADTFCGPVRSFTLDCHVETLAEKLPLPAFVGQPTGPNLPAFLHSCSVGPILMLFLTGPTWLSLALLNTECHEPVAPCKTELRSLKRAHAPVRALALSRARPLFGALLPCSLRAPRFCECAP